MSDGRQTGGKMPKKEPAEKQVSLVNEQVTRVRSGEEKAELTRLREVDRKATEERVERWLRYKNESPGRYYTEVPPDIRRIIDAAEKKEEARKKRAGK